MKTIVGYFLFVFSFVAWAAIALLPFFDLSIAMASAITTGLIIAGEIAFYVSIVLLGKEFLIKVKNYFKNINLIKKIKNLR
jgi:hypothetical protein